MVSYTIPVLFPVAKIVLMAFAVLVLLDYLVLFGRQSGMEAETILGDRFSNGGQNKVSIQLLSKYPFKVQVRLIDEIPDQFRKEHFRSDLELTQGAPVSLEYSLRPVERGEYQFHDINLFVRSPLELEYCLPGIKNRSTEYITRHQVGSKLDP